MGVRRVGHVWSPGAGWIAKQETESRDYAQYVNDSWAFLISFWRWYPDQMLDVLRSDDARFTNEELIQRVMVRAFARYDYVDITGCRSLTKTNTIFKSKLTANILWPGTTTSYYGPGKADQAKLASNAYKEIQKSYPLLTDHYQVDSMAKQSFGVSTMYNSAITINGIRGDNLHNVVAEEYAKAENPNPFNIEEYSSIILYAIRGTHMVRGMVDPTYIPYQQLSITSAGSRQNHAYETRKSHLAMMIRGGGEAGEQAFVVDVPWQVIVLSQMRPYKWVIQRKNDPTTTPEKWAREMESRYTGTDSNAIVRDEVLSESRSLLMMEEHHCCKDRDNKLSPDEVIYCVGFDVAYRDGKGNAKCAVAVTKLTRQTEMMRRDRYLKQVVWLEDWSPAETPTPISMAARIKRVWYRYCYPGAETYLAIDAWQYGDGVLTALMGDLGDGLNPLCTMNHRQYTELELENSVPVVYPIKAGGVGTTDPDGDMVLYAEMQFEHGNMQLLTANHQSGVEGYKKYHRVKDDKSDYIIFRPYKETNKLVNQIQNLKEVPSGAGIAEKRISNHIQRDYWSALKYSLRVAEILERERLQKKQKKSDWDALLKKYKHTNPLSGATAGGTSGRVVVARKGGRHFG